MAVTTEATLCRIENELVLFELNIAKKRISSSSVRNKISMTSFSVVPSFSAQVFLIFRSPLVTVWPKSPLLN